MFAQRSKIRSLISDIEEIQKQGQQVCVEAAPGFIPTEPKSIDATREQLHQSEVKPHTQDREEMAHPKSHLKAVTQEEVVEAGRIGMQLTGNVVIQLQMDLSDEILEIRQILIQNEPMIEIRFMDGKAVHLPVKAVA